MSSTATPVAAAVVAHAGSSSGAGQVKDSGGGGGEGNGGSGRPSTALPANWHETKDPQTLTVYYWNSATGETSWTRPVALPEGWQQAFDDTGKAYYWHKPSGKVCVRVRVWMGGWMALIGPCVALDVVDTTALCSSPCRPAVAH